MAACVIAGRGTQELSMTVRAISYRIPVLFLARIDSMAQKCGKSRNAIMNMMVEIGMDEVYKHFDEDEIHDLQSREKMALQESLDESTSDIKE